jgi:hypothetical protein
MQTRFCLRVLHLLRCAPPRTDPEILFFFYASRITLSLSLSLSPFHLFALSFSLARSLSLSLALSHSRSLSLSLSLALSLSGGYRNKSRSRVCSVLPRLASLLVDDERRAKVHYALCRLADTLCLMATC